MKRLALMFRGPPGVGKSTILKHVSQLASSAGHQVADVNLDNFWYRNRDGSENHLLQKPQQLLLLELAWGEPEARDFNGASLNPMSWYGVLQEQSRVVRIYTFSCDLESAVARDQQRLPNYRVGAAEVRRLHGLYASGADLSVENFSKKLPTGSVHRTINTDLDDPYTIAQGIWAEDLYDPVELPR